MTLPESTRILDFWQSVDVVDPIPDPWAQTAEICFQLERLIAMKCGSEYKVKSKERFYPPQYKPEIYVPPVQTAQEQIDALDKGFGK